MEENKKQEEIIPISSPEIFGKKMEAHFKKKQHLKVLNVGSKIPIQEEYGWIHSLSKNVEIFNLEYDLDYVQGDEHSFYGDICHCPEISDNQFDFIYIVNVLEHVKEPWEAAKECIRICKPDGVILVGAPFAWYYHKYPVDFWRFTPDGLQFLFERTGMVETIDAGFKNFCWSVKKQRLKTNNLESIYICKKK